MEQSAGSGGGDPIRDAARRAREELLRQLSAESEALDRELAALADRMVEGARRIAEERIEREAERFAGTPAGVDREEVRAVVAEQLERDAAFLSGEIEAARAELRERIKATVDGAVGELSGRRLTSGRGSRRSSRRG